MATTIGRISFDRGFRSVRHDDDGFDIEIDVYPSTPAVATVERERILGLVNNDEVAVPVTSTDDDTLDGFYRVEAVRVSPVVEYLQSGLLRVQVSLRRVSSASYEADVEVYGVHHVVTNAHSVTSLSSLSYLTMLNTADANLTLLDFTDYHVGGYTLVARRGSSNPETADGSDTVGIETSGGASAIGGLRTRMTPDLWYAQPAALLELQIGGAWYAWHGRHVPPGVTGWRISNGLVRLGPGTPDAGYKVQAPDGAGDWSTGQEFVVIQETTTPSAIGGPNYNLPIILRNSPDVVSVRADAQYYHSDLWTVKRSVPAVLARPVFSASTSALFGGRHGFAHISAQAGTNVTGGIRTTAADGDGYRLCFVCRDGVTTNTTSCYANHDDGTNPSPVWAIALENGLTHFNAANYLAHACAPGSHSTRVVQS